MMAFSRILNAARVLAGALASIGRERKTDIMGQLLRETNPRQPVLVLNVENHTTEAFARAAEGALRVERAMLLTGRQAGKTAAAASQFRDAMKVPANDFMPARTAPSPVARKPVNFGADKWMRNRSAIARRQFGLAGPVWLAALAVTLGLIAWMLSALPGRVVIPAPAQVVSVYHPKSPCYALQTNTSAATYALWDAQRAGTNLEQAHRILARAQKQYLDCFEREQGAEPLQAESLEHIPLGSTDKIPASDSCPVGYACATVTMDEWVDSIETGSIAADAIEVTGSVGSVTSDAIGTLTAHTCEVLDIETRAVGECPISE